MDAWEENIQYLILSIFTDRHDEVKDKVVGS